MKIASLLLLLVEINDTYQLHRRLEATFHSSKRYERDCQEETTHFVGWLLVEITTPFWLLYDVFSLKIGHSLINTFIQRQDHFFSFILVIGLVCLSRL